MKKEKRVEGFRPSRRPEATLFTFSFTYIGVSVHRNFVLLPVSVASPLNYITLVWIIKNNTFKFILDLISQGMMVSKGILSEDGKLITSWGMWNDIEYLRWMSDEDLKVW